MAGVTREARKREERGGEGRGKATEREKKAEESRKEKNKDLPHSQKYVAAALPQTATVSRLLPLFQTTQRRNE